MAINASTCSPALLSSKSDHAFSFPRSDPHPSFPKFDRCSFPTSRQSHPPSLSTNASLLRAKASENTRQPMLPPYNVLITGSTKGHPPLFISFFVLIFLLHIILLLLFWVLLVSLVPVHYNWACTRDLHYLSDYVWLLLVWELQTLQYIDQAKLESRK